MNGLRLVRLSNVRANSLASGIRRLFEDHPAAANEDTGKRKDGGNQSQEHPKSLDEPPEPAEVQRGQPVQRNVGDSAPRINGIENVKSVGEKKIESGNSPEEHKRKQPEAECAVKIPIDPWKMAAPIDCETTTPVFRSRPPYNTAGEAKRCKAPRADAVEEAAGYS